MNHAHHAALSRRTLIAGLGAGSLFALAGCRSAVDTGASPAGSGASAAATKGGILKITQGADIAPTSVLAQNNVNLSFLRLVYNTLIEIDHESREPKESLATAWSVAQDGKSIDFTLREGVTFHSGRPCTADDVLFTLDYIRKETTASQLKHVANMITAATKSGDLGVRIEFGKPVANLFDLFEIMLILDKDTADKIPDGTFIGTGPFAVDSYAPGSKLTLKRNEKYWKDSRPYLDGVEIAIVRQSQSMVSSLQGGQSQLAIDLSPIDAAALRSDARFSVLVSDAYDSAFYVGANTSVAPLNTKEARQGVAWAIDRKRILDQVLGGIGQTSSLPWSPTSSAFDSAKAGTFSRDIAKATSLFAAAGIAGQTVEVAYNAGLATNASIAEIVVFDLKEAGLAARAVPMQGPDFQAKLTGEGLPGLFVNNHGFGQLSPSTLVKGSFPFNADKNAARFDNADYKALAEKVWTTVDKDQQKAIYGELSDFLLDQQFIVDLVVSSHTFTHTKSVQGVAYTMYDYLNLDNAYLA